MVGEVGYLNFESLSNAVELFCPREPTEHIQYVLVTFVTIQSNGNIMTFLTYRVLHLDLSCFPPLLPG